MAKSNNNEIKKAISDSNAQWTAEENRFTNLPAEKFKFLHGYVPGPTDTSLQDRERISKENYMKFLSKVHTKAESEAAAAASYPVSYDLRNAGGQNFITEVKDQGFCGSCVAFGVLANAEGSLRKHKNDPSLSVDYSEAHLFYCYSKECVDNTGFQLDFCGVGFPQLWETDVLNHYGIINTESVLKIMHVKVD